VLKENYDPFPPNLGVGLTGAPGTYPNAINDDTANAMAITALSYSPKSLTRPGGVSTAFEWTCTQWELDGKTSLIMLINPHTVRWSLPLRITRTNVFGGTVFHRWRSPDGSNADLPTLQFSFNTGRLYTSTEMAGITLGGLNVYQQSSTEKLQAFYQFCSLSRIAAFATNGQPNLISVKYRTLVFPEATLFVHFTDPIQFTEDAMKPYNIEYSCSVVVVRMMPDFNSLDAQVFLEKTHIGNG
jgi:hypothetical protein